ncbi:BBL_G0053530.mRNA.1.CDS.1 [Saccharomyces cerevisiae]|nr:BBL_G0053530.mRNA.1.CDS.1 [Saccharomyces cerevisiae]CAI7371402.1 BBL_G0053530.mRNA.1.CDS.1 [Saccharomyces cerevisiae]
MTIDGDVHEISPFFQVRQTKWGGRACFSNGNIPKGTTVLQVSNFTGTSISYEFRKEVCHNCFAYANAKTMKYKLNYDCLRDLVCSAHYQINPKKFLGAGLWFCSEHCRTSYLQIPNIIELIECYEILLHHFPSMLKRYNSTSEQEEKLNSILISENVIQSSWDEIENKWIPRINNMKSAKRINQLPPICEDEYCCIRMLSIPLLRHILGTEYGNAFGLWQEGEASDSREYFGYWVFPEASYFNHSCNPNITKYRKGNSMLFTVNRDIKKDEQICIDYSGVLDLPTVKRRAFLADSWFFDCACERCKSELQSVH